MSDYAITIAPDGVGHEYQVVLRGPGLDADGRRYVFATTHRCAAFVEAVNFAYQQDRRDAQRRTQIYEEPFLVVTGTTPESLAIGPEGWWPRLKRRLGF